MDITAASSWELAIEAGLGRIDLPEPPRTLIPKVLREQAISPLEITHTHALAVADLPMHHRDPFDRMLAVQANIEKLVVLSADGIFAEYGVETAW